MTQMDLSDMYKHSTQIQKNIPYSQHVIEPSLKLKTYLATKQTSTDTKKWNNPLYLIGSSWSKGRI